MPLTMLSSMVSAVALLASAIPCAVTSVVNSVSMLALAASAAPCCKTRVMSFVSAVALLVSASSCVLICCCNSAIAVSFKLLICVSWERCCAARFASWAIELCINCCMLLFKLWSWLCNPAALNSVFIGFNKAAIANAKSTTAIAATAPITIFVWVDKATIGDGASTGCGVSCASKNNNSVSLFFCVGVRFLSVVKIKLGSVDCWGVAAIVACGLLAVSIWSIARYSRSSGVMGAWFVKSSSSI